ncbi:MAG: antirestriction protein ArdA [Aquisalinus sp.]|nr:antirestriction protein ArdA [Aquisalinus sp.]
MSVLLYAQPYNLEASGFYFRTYEEYLEKSAGLKDRFGCPVEEFEIQFIDGECLDGALAKAMEVSQASLATFLEHVDDWTDNQKVMAIIALSECGFTLEQIGNDPELMLDMDIYEDLSMPELAEQFVDEGVFGDIPEHIAHYIDYELIARDLSMDYCEVEIAGKRLIYRCD